jgi:hypothetical protein
MHSRPDSRASHLEVKENPRARQEEHMLTRIIAVAFLMLAAAPVFASDASFDQRNLATSSQSKDASPRPMACACHRG